MNEEKICEICISQILPVIDQMCCTVPLESCLLIFNLNYGKLPKGIKFKGKEIKLEVNK